LVFLIGEPPSQRGDCTASQSGWRDTKEQRHYFAVNRYSQESFADACALHRTYLGSLERGERNMTLKTIFTVCRTLKITPSELFEGMR